MFSDYNNLAEEQILQGTIPRRILGVISPGSYPPPLMEKILFLMRPAYKYNFLDNGFKGGKILASNKW